MSEPPPDASSADRSEDQHTLFEKWIENPWRPDSGAIVVDSTASPEDCLEHVLRQIQSPSLVQIEKHAPVESCVG